MKVILNKEKYKEKRIFTLYLSAEDTKHILESPYFLKVKFEQGEHVVRFQLSDLGDLIENPVFRLETDPFETYVMYARTGFKTNEDHLEYLINLGPIPMIFGERETCCGYVEIKNKLEIVLWTSDFVFENIMSGVINSIRKDWPSRAPHNESLLPGTR